MLKENDNYLNLLGLSLFFDKLKTLFATKNDLEDIRGDKGDPGVQGVSITKVEQTTFSTADGGTNTITVTLSDGTTSTFDVKNGSKGSTGSSAGFGTPTATIDSNIGTPSVTITSSGTNTAKVFNFAFKNLKGEKGDKGDTGANGATGTRGSIIYWGTGVTGTSTTATVFSGSGVSSALVNDLYLNTSTYNIYQCSTAGAASAAKWVYKGNIKGANGATGTTGTRGSRWTTGTAITGTSTTATVFSGSGITDALVNDMYLNTSTGYVYKCTTAGTASVAKWVYVGSIKGATGASGTNATTTSVATTSANGLMGKDMVTRLNLCASELVQSTEPTTQKKGDSWLQEYT